MRSLGAYLWVYILGGNSPVYMPPWYTRIGSFPRCVLGLPAPQCIPEGRCTVVTTGMFETSKRGGSRLKNRVLPSQRE